MSATLYPAGPVSYDSKKLLPSTDFKKQVGKVITSIIFFFIVYLVLMLAAIALAIGCFYLGISIIIAAPKFLTLILGLGLMAVGVSVLFFLIKFVFAVTKDENSGRVEIKEDEQPELFAFIRRLSTETNTPFPKKIFVSPDVNACVFYNSSFWSMFLPVKKNLEIGLGLVNTINVSEFKAVVAHEFGHFSQRSMKLGSFTYNVNKVIYNMLYENTGYSNFLNSWGRLDGILGLFAVITSKIAIGIQGILKEMYKLVNKSYMGLSREMEFHADAVAASVAGGNNLINGLARIEIASSCYSSALSKATDYLKKNKVSKNIFNNQLTILQSFAKDYSLPIRNELPEVSWHFVSSFSTSRINYKNQWASHPTLEERRKNSEQLQMDCEPEISRAWNIFKNPEQLQESLTQQIYSAAKIEGQVDVFDKAVFEEWNDAEKKKYELPKLYKGFYNKRYPQIRDWDFSKVFVQGTENNFDALFTEEHAKLFSTLKSNEADLELVKAIKGKAVDTKTFDFDGEKITRQECDKVITQLEVEITAQKEKLQLLDQQAATFFFSQAGVNAEDLKGQYQEMLELTKKEDDYINVANEVFNTIDPFYRGGLTLEEIQLTIGRLKTEVEPALKRSFEKMLLDGYLAETHHPEIFKAVQTFNQSNYTYFVANEFINKELEELSRLTLAIAEEWNELKFAQYKLLLEKQAAYVGVAHRYAKV